MGFPLTPRSMTLDDLETAVRSNSLKISRDFACLGGYGTLSFARWRYQHFSETVLRNAIIIIIIVCLALAMGFLVFC